MPWYDGMTDDQIEGAIRLGVAPGSWAGAMIEVPQGFLARRTVRGLLPDQELYERKATLTTALRKRLVDRWPEDDYHVALYSDADPAGEAYSLWVKRDRHEPRNVTGDTDALGRRIEMHVRHIDTTRKQLRIECDEIGDNDWPDDLHLADVVDKHLSRPAAQRIADLETRVMSDAEYRALLDLLMCSDPWPIVGTREDSDRAHRTLIALADREALARGYDGGWVVAYHELRPEVPDGD